MRALIAYWNPPFQNSRSATAASSKVSSPTFAQDENWFLCTSAVFLPWYGVLSVVRWSSDTARWLHVVRFVSGLSRLHVCWVMVGWVAPLVAVADGAVDCGSVESSTARLSHVASGLQLYIVVFQVSCLYYGSHLVMVAWHMGSLFGGHCQWCNFYKTFLIVLWTLFCELWCLTCMCFLRAVCLCVFSRVYTCPMGVLYDAIIVHSSHTLQFSLLLQSPDTVKMGTFLANSVSSTVEESLRQTSIARSGLPRNVLHSLVCTIYIYIYGTTHSVYAFCPICAWCNISTCYT